MTESKRSDKSATALDKTFEERAAMKDRELKAEAADAQIPQFP